MKTYQRKIKLEKEEWLKFGISSPKESFEILYDYSLLSPEKQNPEILPVHIHCIKALVNWSEFKKYSKDNELLKQLFFNAYKQIIAKLRTGITLNRPIYISLHKQNPNRYPSEVRESNTISSSEIAYGMKVSNELIQSLSK